MREAIMADAGRACYAWYDDEVAHSSARDNGDLDRMLSEIRAQIGDQNCRREGNTVYFSYVGSSDRTSR
jgi:hypothetical protein